MPRRNYGSFTISARPRPARFRLNPYVGACLTGTALGVAVMAAIVIFGP